MNSLLYVNLVSVVDCSVLNWVEQKELKGLTSDDRLFGRIAEPGWNLMDFNNSSKCRMGDVDHSHIYFNRKLWILRPVVKDTGRGDEGPGLAEAYAHVKQNQYALLAVSRPLPSQCPQYPPIREMLLGLTSPVVAPRIGAARDAEKRMQKWSEGMEPRFISWNVAAMHTFDFCYPDAWSLKKIKAPPSRKPEVSSDVWSNVYTPADELFYHAGDLTVPARPDSVIDMRQCLSGPTPNTDTNDDDQMDQDDDPMDEKKDKVR